MTVDALLTLVQPHADRPLVNLTGLTGQYQVDLLYLPESQFVPQRVTGQGGSATLIGGANANGDAGIPGTSLFDALLKQVGLKVSPRKSPMPVVAIDHVERIPTEN